MHVETFCFQISLFLHAVQNLGGGYLSTLLETCPTHLMTIAVMSSAVRFEAPGILSRYLTSILPPSCSSSSISPLLLISSSSLSYLINPAVSSLIENCSGIKNSWLLSQVAYKALHVYQQAFSMFVNACSKQGQAELSVWLFSNTFFPALDNGNRKLPLVKFTYLKPVSLL